MYDIYIGMYDKTNSRLVYVMDADPDETTRFMPGDWEEVDPKGLDKFMNWKGEGTLYDIEWTKVYDK